MSVVPPRAPFMGLDPPQVPPYRRAPGRGTIALAGLINANPVKVRILLAALLIAAAAMAASLFGWLVFSDTGTRLLAGMAILLILPRLFVVLLVLGGIIALAWLDQSFGEVARLIGVWWPLALGLAVALPLALLMDRFLFRR